MELSSAVGAVPSALQAQSNNANTSAPPSTTASDADVNLSRINTSVDDVCHNLRLDLQLSRTARKLVKKLLDDSSVCHERQHVMSVSNQSAWICCAVFVANHLTGIEKNIVSLTQLLMTANVRLVDFSNHISHFVSHVISDLPPDFETQAKTYNKQLENSASIFSQYDKLFRLHVKADVRAQDESEVAKDAMLFGFGWLLFLSAKTEICGSFPELHQQYILLLSVIRFLVEEYPGSLSSSADPDPLKFLATVDGVVDNHLYKQVKAMDLSRFRVFLREMVARNILYNSLPPSSSRAGTASSVESVEEDAFHGDHSFVFHPKNIGENVSRLGHQYDNLVSTTLDDDADALQRGFWLDERIFLRDHAKDHSGSRAPFLSADAPFASSRGLGAAIKKLYGDCDSFFGTPYAFSAFSPVTATPSRSHAAATPITRMMEAVNWLNNTLLSAEPCSSSSVPSSPTDDLSCDDNLTRLINMLPQPAASQHPQNSELSSSVSSVANSSQHIAAGADGDDISLPPTIPPDHRKTASPPILLIAAVVQSDSPRISFPSLLGREDHETNRLRRQLAVKLYYRVLADMIDAEKKRLGSQPRDLSNWLNIKSFHRSLLAVCFEIVIFSYKIHALAFPAVLEKFGLHAFDLIKVTESVVRHCSSLPRSIKAHLRDIEFAILDSLAWRSCEPLSSLLAHEDCLHHLQRRCTPKLPSAALKPPLPTSNSSIAASSAATSSVPSSSSVTASTDASSTSTSPPRPSGSVLACELFYRKLLSLAADRLAVLCEQSRIPEDRTELIWMVVVHVLLHQPSLLVNRHLDVVILCSMYAIVNKILKTDLKFRQIIAAYVAKWENNSEPVIRLVFVSDSQPRTDIINFYNSMYIPAIKTYLMDTVRHLVRFEPSNAPVIESSPLRSPLPRRAAFSPRRVGHGPNIVVAAASSSASPLRDRSSLTTASPRLTSQSVFMTPITRQFYSFGESPSRSLQEINRLVNKDASSMSSDAGDGSDAEPSARFKRKLGYSSSDVPSKTRRPAVAAPATTGTASTSLLPVPVPSRSLFPGLNAAPSIPRITLSVPSSTRTRPVVSRPTSVSLPVSAPPDVSTP